ncbi:sorbitol/mannitol transport system permease protein [Nakamurella panacisegetis]|uniref:Sorbitol/mannitol transport system permease protein n=1 Tax=Nakamurella panacisegetis TaxID=1090615 RepID=A0A1H0NY85_9ACTN|nr:carbohydrate ABC transporter permease [Nakamurella panacisegetis]SDO97644.1 sorbitol/mannitol transport system permease protein [Nakamurella panacisegetis]
MTTTAIPATGAHKQLKEGGAGKRKAGGIIATVGTWIIGLIFIAPVFFMVLTSFHAEAQASLNAPNLFAPLTLDGYREFFGSKSGQSPWPFLLNSLLDSVVSTLLVLVLAIPAAYALSVKPVKKWTDVMFFFLSTKFLPAAAGLVPLFVIANNIGALNHSWFLIILYTAMNLPIAVWMMRSFLADIPPALFEAASLDGAGLAKTLTRVVAPIAMPGIASTSLICFIFAWNELLMANLLTSSQQAQTAPVFLTSFITSQGLFLAKVSAAAFAVSVPVLVAGFAAQDKLVQGLSLGAVK